MVKLLLIIGLSLALSCASPGKFTPAGATIATGAVNVATGLLHALDGFYGDLLTMKLVPDYTAQATRALTLADTAAPVLKKIIAGQTVTNEELNLVAGKVDGAKAILRGMK